MLSREEHLAMLCEVDRRYLANIGIKNLIELAESYLAHNAAESGADVLIRELVAALRSKEV